MSEKFNVEDRNYSKEYLDTINSKWSKEASVMNFNSEIESYSFDLNRDDFIDDMIPFTIHPAWSSLDDDLKTRIRSCGWLLYQENTVYIETGLVIPACNHVIEMGVSNIITPSMIVSMGEAITDEGYHTLLAIKTCEEVRKNRNLEHIRPKEFHLVNEMRKFIKSLSSEQDRRISMIATACCTENHITDYLDLLYGNDSMQPLCVKAVEAHAKDEWVHGSVFNILAQSLYPTLNGRGKKVFRDTIEHVAKNFFRADIEAWLSVMNTLNDSRLTPFKEEIQGLREEYDKKVEFTNNNNGLRKLYEKLEWQWNN